LSQGFGEGDRGMLTRANLQSEYSRPPADRTNGGLLLSAHHPVLPADAPASRHDADGGFPPIVLKTPKSGFSKIRLKCHFGLNSECDARAVTPARPLAANPRRRAVPPRLNSVRPPTALIFRGRRRKRTFSTQSARSAHSMAADRRSEPQTDTPPPRSPGSRSQLLAPEPRRPPPAP
jgi:hypothetical protein